MLVNAANTGPAGQTRYEYGPFGEVVRATGPMTTVNPFRFFTKFTDDESDFIYYGLRYYNPSTGRWPTVIRIGLVVMVSQPTQHRRYLPLARVECGQDGKSAEHQRYRVPVLPILEFARLAGGLITL